MATLTLTKTFINLMTTGASVAAYRNASDDDTQAMTGRVSTYAGGRQRAITQAGVQSQWKVPLRQVTAADVETLRSWMGQTVLVRDNRGRKAWGIILEVPRAPWKEQLDTYDVDLTLLGVDVDETV